MPSLGMTGGEESKATGVCQQAERPECNSLRLAGDLFVQELRKAVSDLERLVQERMEELAFTVDGAAQRMSEHVVAAGGPGHGTAHFAGPLEPAAEERRDEPGGTVESTALLERMDELAVAVDNSASPDLTDDVAGAVDGSAETGIVGRKVERCARRSLELAMSRSESAEGTIIPRSFNLIHKAQLAQVHAARHGFAATVLEEVGQRAPPRQQDFLQRCFSRICDSYPFHTCTMLLIVSSTVFVGVHTHRNAKAVLAGEPAEHYQVTNLFFTVAFSLELACRLLAERREFFFGSLRYWNMFDGLVVLLAVTEAFVAAGISSRLFRTVRLFRMLRVMRVARDVTRVARVIFVLRPLRHMMLSIASSCCALFWALMLMMVVMYIAAIIFMQAVYGYMQDYGTADLNMGTVRDFYGSLPLGMFSVGLAISGGVDWYMLVEPLIVISPAYAFAYSMYVGTIIFGVMNVLVATFVEASQNIERVDQEYVIQEELMREDSHLIKFKSLFRDIDQSGVLSMAHLFRSMETDAARAFFRKMDITDSDVLHLFLLLDVDGSRQVDLNKFAMCCLRMKGVAKAIDIACMQYENQVMEENNHKRFSQLEEKMAAQLSLLHEEIVGLKDTSVVVNAHRSVGLITL